MKLQIQDQIYEYKEGTNLYEISRSFALADEILLAQVNGKLRELHHSAKDGDTVKWLTIRDKTGYKTYQRSCVMLFFAAAHHVLPREKTRRMILHFSVQDGLYLTFEGTEALQEEEILAIKDEMDALVQKALPLKKASVGTEEAIELFRSLEMKDREQLFSTRLASRVNLYSLNGYQDYYYGYMVHDTSVLREYRLHSYQDGVILQLPKFGNGMTIGDFTPSEKLFRAQIEGELWAGQQGIGTVADLNDKIITTGAQNTILVSEAMMEQRITAIAESIQERDGVKFVMIAGPSSSGKTTFSQRLSVQLAARGFTPHYIGVDNYFHNRVDVPLDEYGQKDFESLRAVDVELFNHDMSELLMGKRIKIPTFDFLTGKRVYHGEELELHEEDILVIEGIHCLNDELSHSLPKESKYKIYISALTQVNLDEHNRISTTDCRLLRRIVRDHRTRGYSAAATLAMWDSVRRGEERYIFPFQDEVDAFFNSALPYELAALKLYAEPLLFQVKRGDPTYNEARRLLKFLDYFIGIPDTGSVPTDSIIREFIGGGCFRL